jgi:hypothetical protein
MSTTEQMRQHQARCLPHRVRLRMLAHDLAVGPVTSRVLYETAQETSAILAEAQAGCRSALTPAADGRHSSGHASLLRLDTESRPAW